MRKMEKDLPLSSIKHIGQYLEGGFVTRSFWPPESNKRYPIRSTTELLQFVKSRGNRDHELTRARLTAWLREVTLNARAEDCVPPPVTINRTQRHYKIRYSNFLGYNAIVQFLQTYLRDTNHYEKIPRKINQLSRTRKHPLSCRV